MSDFPIDLLIRQTLRSFVFDSTNMGIMTSKAEHFQTRNNITQKSTVDNSFWGILRSSELMKNLYDKPSEYVHNLFENESFKEAIANAKDEQEIQKEKNRILFSFLKDVRDSRPPPAMEWIAFQHYLYYVYRNFLSPMPVVTSEVLPSILIKKMYALIVSLSHEDKTQFYVRIITLLREYVWVAKDNFEQIKSTAEPTAYLICLLAYYSAFCSAANKLSTVLSDFDQFINDRFHINWYCLNQRIFYQYFYSSGAVQAKVHLFDELLNDKNPSLKKLLEAYKTFLDDMKLLDGYWQTQRRRITVLSDKNCKVENQTPNDWKMFGEITKIMKTNYWIIRNEETKALQDMYELDGHILALVGDTWHIADRLIASKGNCICEDCMIAEFKINLSAGTMASVVPQQAVQTRHITCYICRESIALEALASHIVTKHADLSIPRADLTKTYKWHLSPPMKKNSSLKRPSTKLCKVLSETMEELAKKKEGFFPKEVPKIEPQEASPAEIVPLKFFQTEQAEVPDSFEFLSSSLKTIDNPEQQDDPLEPLLKVACDAPNLMDYGDDIEACRLVFEKYVKYQQESLAECLKKEEDTCCNSDMLLPKINGLLDKTNGLMKKERASRDAEEIVFDTTHMPRPLRRRQKKKATIADAKMLDLILNIDKEKSAKSKETKSEMPCVGHGCGHKCKKEDGVEQKKKEDNCDHQKEAKKCDCAYCEVFGNGASNHTHKSTETRDRLRTRLNQRKEKITTEVHKENEIPLTEAMANLSVKATVTKGVPKVANASVKSSQQSFTAPAKILSKEPAKKVSPKIPENCSHESQYQACTTCVPDVAKTNNGSKTTKPTSAPTKSNDQENQKTGGAFKVTDPFKCTDGLSSLSKSFLNDIDALFHFIEGHKPVDKVALAQKKAAKKARQRQRKEEEKQRKEAEEEAKRREEERIRQEKLREEERLKAIELAKKQAEELKKNKKNKNDGKKQPETKSKKKKKGGQTSPPPTISSNFEMMEESIPAVVTIKRVVENENSPPLVTITLKGQTPDQDKLLYTLVNGTSNEVTATSSANVNNKNSNLNSNKNKKSNVKNDLESPKNESKKSKKKNKNSGANSSSNATHTTTLSNVTSNELKVTLAVDKSFRKCLPPESTKQESKPQNSQKKNKEQRKADAKQQLKSVKQEEVKETDFDLPSLRLPPGITITKVNGPLTNKNGKPAPSTTTSVNIAANSGQSFPPVSKSGVIVVDTEKLIQQSLSVTASKKSKKKKKKQNILQQSQPESVPQPKQEPESKPAMVTLKNPIFHTLQTKLVEKREMPIIPCNEQASITKGENGMVTIRRPRCLQLPLENESPMSEFLNELKPVMQPERPPHFPAPGTMPNGKIKARTPFNPESYISDTSPSSDFRSSPQDNFMPSTSSSMGCYDDAQESTNVNAGNKPPVLSAHDILWGLPGIEITKVNKNSTSHNADMKKCEQTADVSIIPTSTNGEKFHFDKDDWPYESVFAPKDILEEDLDADERELEAFKRFCSQSVPPKHKEKVTHLNVKDIIFKKKTDVTYS